MRIIDRNRRQFVRPKRPGFKKGLRYTLVGFAGLAVVFVLANLAMALLYRNKVLPNYSVASARVGSVAFDKLDKQVSIGKILPPKVTLSKDDKKIEIAPKDLGAAIDWPVTKERLKSARLWLPLVSLVTKHEVPAQLRLDTAQFEAKAKELEAQFAKAALPERIVLNGENFAIAPPEAGYNLDTKSLRIQVLATIERGKISLHVPTTQTAAAEPVGKLGSDLDSLQKRLASKITLAYAGKTIQLSRNQIGRFYEPAGQSMQLSTAKMSGVMGEVASSFGVVPINQDEAVSAALHGLLKSQAVTFLLASNSTKVYRYCAAVKGISSSALPEFRHKLAAVYGDPKGWNRGNVALVYAESGCDYTAWLTQADLVPSFSSVVCDNYYSCRVGPNVIINYDRWMGATDPWNAAGGSLEDYRVMVINHETGHWFGFNHRDCPGAGQPAPVMQQQSISLQGCTFNPWPTAAEIASL